MNKGDRCERHRNIVNLPGLHTGVDRCMLTDSELDGDGRASAGNAVCARLARAASNKTNREITGE